jgi:outer membrane protein assembly factor BamB
VVGDRLVVGDEAGSVRAFNVSTGTLLWTTATGPINNIVVAGGRVFTDTGLGDGQLRALDLKTGKILWDVGGIAGSSSPPTVAGGVVYQNSDGNGKVLAFNAATGAPVWSSTVGAGASSVVAGKSLLFFGTQAGDLLALNRKTGATVWDTTLGGEIYATGTSHGLAFASSFSGIVYALNAKTGKIDWSFNTGSGFQSSALVSADGRVFVSSQGADPTLYALNEYTGAVLWSLPGATAPVVADGLIFASDPGEVIAIGATPEPSTILLLGSSFVGLGGVALRRRQRVIGRRVVRAKREVGS